MFILCGRFCISFCCWNSTAMQYTFLFERSVLRFCFFVSHSILCQIFYFNENIYFDTADIVSLLKMVKGRIVCGTVHCVEYELNGIAKKKWKTGIDWCFALLNWMNKWEIKRRASCSLFRFYYAAACGIVFK